MQFWQYVFFISCFLIFYNYGGYALIIYIINKIYKPYTDIYPNNSSYFPNVSFIVAAYNEEDFIKEKIINSLEQNYPSANIEFIFVTDGSSDSTNDIIGQYPRIKLLYNPDRNGKSAAINRAVLKARNEIVIFSDANTTLNKDATLNISRHYQNEKVGGVAGEKKVISLSDDNNAASGEGLYWKYESALKKADSGFYSVVGAAGELFSLRKELYTPLPHNIILDDFILSLKVAEKGFRIIYEPEAYAMELPSFSVKDEQKRKVRIAAGGFQSIGILTSLLKFWKQPRLSFLYISHRVFRWAVSPFCLIIAFIANAILAIGDANLLFKVLFLLQVAFYSMAIIASLNLPGSKHKIFKLPFYFTFMNVSVILGFFRFLRGSQSAIWEKARRTQLNTL